MSSSNSPCAACKFLRRKCTQDCVFAPYFPADQPQKFSTVHKVFGASNVSKLLNDLESKDREEAVNSLAYEADFRLKDPVYGCVGLISILQQHLKALRIHLDLAKKELASMVGPSSMMQMLQNPHLQSQFHPNAAGAGASAYSSHPHHMGGQYNAAQMMSMMQMAGAGAGAEPLSIVDLQMQFQLQMQQQQQQLQQQLSGQLVIRDEIQKQPLQQHLSGQLVIRDGIHEQQPLQQQFSGQLVIRDGSQQHQNQPELDSRQIALMIQAREEREVMRKLRQQQQSLVIRDGIQAEHYQDRQPDDMRFNQGFNQEDNAEFGQMGTEGAAMAPLMGGGFDGGNPYQIQQQQQPIQQVHEQHQQLGDNPYQIQLQIQEQQQLGENPIQIQQQQQQFLLLQEPQQQQEHLLQQQQQEQQFLLLQQPQQSQQQQEHLLQQQQQEQQFLFLQQPQQSQQQEEHLLQQQQQEQQFLLLQQPQQSQQQELLFHEHHYHPPAARNEEEGEALDIPPPNC